MDQEKPKPKKSASSYSWSLSPEELKYQVDNYSKLKFSESFRGSVVIFTGIILALSILAVIFGISPPEALVDVAVFAILLIFVYKGHRWAIVSLMILWTIEKGYQLIVMPSIIPILWWALTMPYFYKALRVEIERKKQASLPGKSVPKNFCSNCGASLDADSKFCISCGNKVGVT